MDELNGANTEDQTQGHGLSRRTLVRGAAYAVPAVTLLSATPAMAASGGNMGQFILQSVQRDNANLNVSCSAQGINNSLIMTPGSVIITFTFTTALSGNVTLGGTYSSDWSILSQTTTTTSTVVMVSFIGTITTSGSATFDFSLLGAGNTKTNSVTATADAKNGLTPLTQNQMVSW